MSTVIESSDAGLIELLRTRGVLSVAELAAAMDVTPTAVRQRLARLMGQGLVDRQLERNGRGRPGHRYSLTDTARRHAGTNFADLAVVLWHEIRDVKDPEVRRGLLQRVAKAMALAYGDQVSGDTLAEKMKSVGALMAERRVPFAVDESGGLPVLTALDCPYPELARADRGICAVEKMMFSELLEQDVRLSQCRLDGHSCCQFQSS